MEISCTLFGSLRVRWDGRALGERDFGGRKPKQLLEILLLRTGRYQAKEELAEQLWGDRPMGHAANTIEHYVSLIRKRLGPAGSVLMTGHGGYRIDGDRVWLDIVAFERLADSATEPGRIEEALALVTGDVLEDEPYAEWAVKARLYYGQRYQRLLVGSAEARLGAGDFARAEELAAAAVRADPLAEPAHRLLMAALYAGGRRREALAAYRTCQQALADEAGLEPMSETAVLNEAMVARAPAAVLLAAVLRGRWRGGAGPPPYERRGPIPDRRASSGQRVTS